MNLEEAKTLYIRAKDAYYNTGRPIITDAQYDKLENWITKKDPNWPELNKTGIRTINKKQEVKLPFFMPSLNKFYPEEVDKLWSKLPVSKEYIYMAKLDGCSVLLEYYNGIPFKLITRGDGTFGKDISFLLKYLNCPNIFDKKYHAYRCEAILAKSEYETKWKSEFDNARNMVSGLLNRREYHPAMKSIDFVVLGEYSCKLLDSLKSAKEFGLSVVPHYILNANQEAIVYNSIKNSLTYEADGVVITTPDFLYSYDNADKPKSRIFAYKENLTESEVEATVEDIIWQASSFGRLTPKIKITPTMIQGAKVTYATCHNAKWMIDHSIGIGAIVKLVRSGDVIPKIVGVVKPGKIKYPDCAYYSKGVHFYQEDNSEDVTIKLLERAVVNLGIESVKYNTLKDIYDARKNLISSDDNSVDILMKFLAIKDFKSSLQIQFGAKSGSNIYNELNKLYTESHTIIDFFMAAVSTSEGIGRKRLALVDKACDLSKMVSWNKQQILSLISDIQGIGLVLAESIADNLVKFFSWYSANSSKFSIKKELYQKESVEGPLSGVSITFTGYRDEFQEKAIKSLGGSVISFCAKTTWLLYKAGGKKSSKIDKAGDKAIQWLDLVNKYPMLNEALDKAKPSLF